MSKSRKAKDRYMTVLGAYTLDMHNHGCLIRQTVAPRVPGKDFGADPVGDGTFRMVPSGDIVSYDERCARLGD